MSRPKCSVEGCERNVAGRGLCHSHHSMARQRGALPETGERTKASLYKTNEQRLLEHSRKQPNGCREWIRALDSAGYGQTAYRHNGTHRGVRAHRLAYEVWNGPIPDGLMVRHTCDNRKCIEPTHLILGTAQDNADDLRSSRRRKGEGAGDRNGRARLTNEQAEEIRMRYRRGGISQEQLADEYGVSQFAVSAIVRGKRYAVPATQGRLL
jgi:DNA-binding XRE family transcriptional regulator